MSRKRPEPTLPRFIVYDARARWDMDRAAVLVCEDTWDEAVAAHKDFGEIVIDDIESGALFLVSKRGVVSQIDDGAA